MPDGTCACSPFAGAAAEALHTPATHGYVHEAALPAAVASAAVLALPVAFFLLRLVL